jgi:hypothetical protein
MEWRGGIVTFTARHVHISLIPRNWRLLSAFYLDVFGCVPVPPEQDLKGPFFDTGTGISALHLQGMPVHLPGYADSGPTLDKFSCSPQVDPPELFLNRPGFDHNTFLVENVTAARDLVLTDSDTSAGAVITSTIADESRFPSCCVRDSEGNDSELQPWKYEGENGVE